MCCNMLHHRVWNAPALHNRSRLRHQQSHDKRQTHILRWGFSWHRRNSSTGPRESESPAATAVCSSSSVSPNISHSSQRIYISRVPNNVSLRSYRFFCLLWLARPFGHVIIRRRYYPQCRIAACSNSIGSGDLAHHHRVLLCNGSPMVAVELFDVLEQLQGDTPAIKRNRRFVVQQHTRHFRWCFTKFIGIGIS